MCKFPKNCIIAYADADFAGDPGTRRSRSGAAIMVGSASQATCIAHRLALQEIISLSTAAAEIIALVDACMSVEEVRRGYKKSMKEWYKSVRERQ